MATILRGRHTTGHAGSVDDLTVFLIGMRFNSPLRVASWWPAFSAMPRMLRRLESDPEYGLLAHHLWVGRTTILLSYWQSAEHLQRFAADANGPHLAPWRAFARRAAGDDSVGIWHETYVVGEHETVYVDMPAFGLGKAVGTQPVGPDTQTARRRLQRR